MADHVEGEPRPRPTGTGRRGRRWLIAALATLAAAVIAAVVAVVVAPAQTNPTTVVSLTFDDGVANQMRAKSILADAGLHGTFFVPSGGIDNRGALTVAQLRAIAKDGNEIGSHTASHQPLTSMSSPEALRQICQDRANLTGWGLKVTSLAYPNGIVTPDIQQYVAACGFNSARAAADLREPSGQCDGCPLSESTRPKSLYAIRTPGAVDDKTTVAQLIDTVRRVESAGGGWLPLVFHNICESGCGKFTTRPAVLTAFVKWLATREKSGTVTRTVNEVIGGRVRPLVPMLPVAPHGVINPSYETADSTGAAACWARGEFGLNKVRTDRIPAAAGKGSVRTGKWAGRVVMTTYRNGDAKLMQKTDLGQCAIPVTAGRKYTLKSWYRSTARTQFAVYRRTTTGKWAYWWSSPYFPVTNGLTWQSATAQTPPIPPNTTGLSFGLTLGSVGTLLTDDVSIVGAS